MKKVLLLKGISQYDAMRIYIDEYAKGLEQEGFESIILDAKEDDILDQIIKNIKSNKIDWIFTCNGVLLEDKFFNDLLNQYNIKKCTFFYDHPIYHNERLNGADLNTIVLTCDRNHANYIKQHFNNIGLVDFLPLSGSYLNNYIPYNQRTIELLFTGSYSNKDVTLSNLKNLPDVYYKIAIEMIEKMIDEPESTIEDTLNDILNYYQFERTNEEFHLMLLLLANVDKFMREYYREKLIRSIVENDIVINVHGNGWDKFPCKRENIIIREGYGNKALQSLANTKISLNIMPWFRAGFQERIASAMLSGAVSLTDTSDYIASNFKNYDNIVVYSLKELYKLPGIIRDLLNNSEKAMRIAENGLAEAQKNHTWHNRMKEVINIIEKFEKSKEPPLINDFNSGN